MNEWSTTVLFHIVKALKSIIKAWIKYNITQDTIKSNPTNTKLDKLDVNSPSQYDASMLSWQEQHCIIGESDKWLHFFTDMSLSSCNFSYI